MTEPFRTGEPTPFDSLVEHVDEYEPLQAPAPALGADQAPEDGVRAEAIDAEILAGLVSP